MIPMQAYPILENSDERMWRRQTPSKLIPVSHASPTIATFRHLSPLLPHIKSPPTTITTTALSKLPLSPMADSPPQYEVEIQPQYHERGGLSVSQILALITLLPTGGTLLLFAGLTFAASMVGLAVATPLFLIFSPVLVPAAVVVGLAVSGFITSQTLGATGVSALSCAWDYLPRVLGSLPLKDMVDRMGKGHAQKDGPVSFVQLETYAT